MDTGIPGQKSPSTTRQSAARTLLVFAAAAAGTLLGLGSSVLAMRALGPAGFGVVAVATTYMTILWQFTGRGLEQAFVRLAVEAGQGANARRAAAFGAAMQIKLVLGGLLAAGGLAAAGPAARYFLGADTPPGAMQIAALAALAASVAGQFTAAAQALERFGRFSGLQLLAALTRFCATGALVLAGMLTPALALLTLAGGYALAALTGWWLTPRELRSARADAAQRARLTGYARWLVVSSVIHLLYSRLDHLLLARLSGAAAVGVYGAAAQFIQVVDLLTGSLLTVLLPRVCAAPDIAGLRRAAGTSLRLSALLAAPLLAAFPLARPVLTALLGAEFGACVPLLLTILPGALVNVLTHPLQAVLHSRGRTHWLTTLDVAALALSVAAYYPAIHSHGALGAALVNLCMRLLVSAVLSILVWVELRETRRTGKQQRGPAAAR